MTQSPPRRRWVTDLSPRAQREIIRIGKTLAPEEACGIILPPDYVVRLPNRAKASKRTESYEVREDDVVEATERWLDQIPGAQVYIGDLDFVVWHTHPNGFVGPSKRDLNAKRKLYPTAGEEGGSRIRFLVISLPWGEASFF